MIEDNKENEDNASERGRTAIIFSLKNEVGGLVKALKLFQVCNNHIAGAGPYYLINYIHLLRIWVLACFPLCTQNYPWRKIYALEIRCWLACAPAEDWASFLLMKEDWHSLFLLPVSAGSAAPADGRWTLEVLTCPGLNPVPLSPCLADWGWQRNCSCTTTLLRLLGRYCTRNMRGATLLCPLAPDVLAWDFLYVPHIRHMIKQFFK